MQVLVFEVLLRAYCIRQKSKKPDTVSDSVLRQVRTYGGPSGSSGLTTQRQTTVTGTCPAPGAHVGRSSRVLERIWGLSPRQVKEMRWGTVKCPQRRAASSARGWLRWHPRESCRYGRGVALCRDSLVYTFGADAASSARRARGGPRMVMSVSRRGWPPERTPNALEMAHQPRSHSDPLVEYRLDNLFGLTGCWMETCVLCGSS